MRKNNKLSKLRKSTMKVEALENRQLLSHEALLLSGDATATDHATDHKDITGVVNTYNGFEQSSLVASYAATPGELTRVSFLDPDGDVVFAEFGGNGKLTISFEQHESAQPSPYLQSTTWYSQGLATLSVSGGDESTFLSVFSLGNDPLRVDVTIIDGDSDDPTNASFEGANFMADIRAVEVLGAGGQVNHFGGLGLANTNFRGTGRFWRREADRGDRAGCQNPPVPADWRRQHRGADCHAHYFDPSPFAAKRGRRSGGDRGRSSQRRSQQQDRYRRILIPLQGRRRPAFVQQPPPGPGRGSYRLPLYRND